MGLGTVGTAQAFLLSKLGYEVCGYDPQVKNSSSFVKLEDKPTSNADVTFICTHENHVEEALSNLLSNGFKHLCVIKSTTPPNTTKDLMRKYGVHICHNPEFLREKYAFEDVVNPSRIIIGQCCAKHGFLLKRLYKPLKRPIYVTDPTTSELVKLTVNVLRATVITFWNEIHELAIILNLDTRTVADLVNQAKTINTWEGGKWGTRFLGKKFGGFCLPKDVDQIINTFQQHALDPILFQAIKEFNER